MKDTEQRAAAKQFSEDWLERGDEKQETQSFWMSLLQKVFGVEEPEKTVYFEWRVEVDNTKTGKCTTKFIDAYIPETRTLIEQKGMSIDLHNAYSQSDGSMLTPYQQARRYGGYLPQSEQPRWIIVCNFQEFHIHDMNRPNDTPEIVKLEDLEKEYHRLAFIVVFAAAVIAAAFLAIRAIRKKEGHTLTQELPVWIAAILLLGWLVYFVISHSLKLPLLRNGFRMVVFSVIIMIVVLFFRRGIMGDRELPDVLRGRRLSARKSTPKHAEKEALK